jgi:phage repressor protein C with HTH and peptisase S24 domain
MNKRRATNLDAVCGEPTGFIDRPCVLNGVEGAYAVRVTGECMQPRYEPGWLVYVNPVERVSPGRDVVVYRKGDTEGLIKQFVGWDCDDLVLSQYNPIGTIRIPRDKVAMCNLVVGARHEG